MGTIHWNSYCSDILNRVVDLKSSNELLSCIQTWPDTWVNTWVLQVQIKDIHYTFTLKLWMKNYLLSAIYVILFTIKHFRNSDQYWNWLFNTLVFSKFWIYGMCSSNPLKKNVWVNMWHRIVLVVFFLLSVSLFLVDWIYFYFSCQQDTTYNVLNSWKIKNQTFIRKFIPFV